MTTEPIARETIIQSVTFDKRVIQCILLLKSPTTTIVIIVNTITIKMCIFEDKKPLGPDDYISYMYIYCKLLSRAFSLQDNKHMPLFFFQIHL